MPMIFLLANLVVYALFTIMILTGNCDKKIKQEFIEGVDAKDEDELVAEERERIIKKMELQPDAGDDKEDILLVNNLVKVYKGKDPDKKGEKDDAQALNSSTKSDRPLSESQVIKKKEEEKKSKKGKKVNMAVKGTSFGVKRGEIFGLLGVNGAGKTTTFNCMVGLEDLSGGQIRVDGLDILDFYNRPEKLHGILGYCP